MLALLAAALAARKRIAWWILVAYMVAASAGTSCDLVDRRRDRGCEEIGELIGLAFHVAAIVFLLLARKEFWAKVRRGALLKAAAALVAGMAIGTLIGWGAARAVPRHPGP